MPPLPTSSSPTAHQPPSSHPAADDFPDDPFSSPHRTKLTPSGSSPPSTTAGSSRAPGPASSSEDSLATWAKSTRFAVLSRFSHVTSAARSSAHSLLSHPVAQRLASPPSSQTTLAQHGPVGPLGPSDPDWRHSSLVREIGGEFDSARVFLARFARQVAEEGERNRRAEEQAKANGTAAGGGADSEELGSLGAFEILDLQPSVRKPRSSRIQDHPPLGQEEWQGFFNPETGEPIISLPELRFVIFSRGLSSELGPSQMHSSSPDGVSVAPQQPRCDAWCALLGASEWRKGVGSGERAQGWAARAERYWRFKREWVGPRAVAQDRLGPALADAQQASLGEEEKEEQERQEVEAKALRDSPFMRDQLHRVLVDCLRTDRKIPLFSAGGEDDDEDEDAKKKRDEGSGAAATGRENGQGEANKRNPHVRRLMEILVTYVLWDKAGGEEGEEKGDRAVPPKQRGEDAASAPPASAAAGDPAVPQPKSTPANGRTSLGSYVQGMSDLCAPLYVVCGADEVKTFWCFAGLMERMRANFYSDQTGMRRQLSLLQKLIAVMDPGLYSHLERTDSLHLFFCFRWLLVLFKREFGFEDVLKLWEGIWAAEPASSLEPDANGVRPPLSPPPPPSDSSDEASDNSPSRPARGAQPSEDSDGRAPLLGHARLGLSSNFQLFIALSILEQHREPVLRYLFNFDEVLQYFNGLAHHIEAEETLRRAEVLVLTLRALIEQKDKADEALAGDEAGEGAKVLKASPAGDGDASSSPGGRGHGAKARQGSSGSRSLNAEQAQLAAALPEIDDELRELVRGRTGRW